MVDDETKTDDESVPLADPITVNVKQAVKPVVLWLCPKCGAACEGNDPAMIKHLMKGGFALVVCMGCGVSLRLQIPKIVEATPGINRHARRGLVKIDGGKGRRGGKRELD